MDVKQEIKDAKLRMNDCENTDYATGYISALSFVEGVLAEAETPKPRLIDATALIAELAERVRTPRSCMEILRDIIPMVERQPTAYDKEKVIREFEILENEYGKMAHIYHNEGNEDKYNVAIGREDAYKTSARIARKGGINGKK